MINLFCRFFCNLTKFLFYVIVASCQDLRRILGSPGLENRRESFSSQITGSRCLIRQQSSNELGQCTLEAWGSYRNLLFLPPRFTNKSNWIATVGYVHICNPDLKERVQGTCSNPNERYVNEKRLERWTLLVNSSCLAVMTACTIKSSKKLPTTLRGWAASR